GHVPARCHDAFDLDVVTAFCGGVERAEQFEPLAGGVQFEEALALRRHEPTAADDSGERVGVAHHGACLGLAHRHGHEYGRFASALPADWPDSSLCVV